MYGSKKNIDNVNKKIAAEGIQVNSTFSEKRSIRAPIESVSDPIKTFEITCHNVILDASLESMKKRYESHEELYKQISCFDPNRFQEVIATPERIDLSIISKQFPT